jgi:hypothetical protein
MACDALPQITTGKALVVTDDENCIKELIQPEGASYPALAIALSDNKAVLRDGSVNQPIQLPHLQTQTGGSFQKMMIQDAAGVWYVYEPNEDCIDLKLIVRDGAFDLVRDTLPQILDANFCEINECSEYDFLIGAKQVTLTCDGEDVVFLKLVKVPKTLCPICAD